MTGFLPDAGPFADENLPYLFNFMKGLPNKTLMPWWHSLMYSTGILLLVCGLPGTLLFWLGVAFGLPGMGDFPEIFEPASRMIAAEIIIAGILLLLAHRISKHREPKGTTAP
ncbi:MAG: hypothetical protein ABIS50_10980 [Luteolibacter sp.]|uniref:hypothetical protein n=1 Tax=Luteolibacter sp. TaxID=1962973 RepID=UPI003262CD8D